MKIPFDIKYRPQIESGEYKVETRNGLPVRIICWDRKHGYPIVGLAYEKATGCESYVSAYEDGTTSANGKMELSDDLFIVTPEEELTEFEKAVGLEIFDEPFEESHIKVIKKESAKLLSLARKELIEERYTSDPRKTDLYKLGRDETFKEIEQSPESSYAFKRGVEYGKEEALKDLPRWKKIKEADNACVREPHVGTNMLGEKMLYIGNHAISISRLEKLPGFKED